MSSLLKKKPVAIAIIIGVLALAGVLALLVINRQASQGFDSAQAVGQAYARAYETKDFSQVVREGAVCQTYKEQYGLDTSQLESSLQPFGIASKVTNISQTSDTEYEVDILLTLSASGQPTEESPIFIKVLQENGAFTFCGEGERKTE